MLARAKRAKREFVSLGADLEIERKGREEAKKLAKLEHEGREEASNSIKQLQVELESKKEELSIAFHQCGALKDQVSVLEREAKDLKNSMPAIEVQAIEKLCAQGALFANIGNMYVAGFLKCQELAQQQPNNFEGIELPIAMGLTPELEARILEKRGDVFAILQLIREE